MGKLTTEQAAQLAELQALSEAPDTDDEFEVLMADPEGHQIRVPWSRVPASWRKRFGFEDPAAAAGEGEGGDGKPGEGEGDGKDPKPPPGHRYFK
jgi:hypothetical protein